MLLLATASVSCSHRPAVRPHILLFVWDTCRGDRVSANGYPHPTTPRLEELAADGVNFRNCFTPSPWTPPAHASLFTGLLPRTHGLREGMGDMVRPGLPLLASTLGAAGYETVSVSANPNISVATGLNGGFEFDFPCYRSEDVSVAGEAVREQVRRWVRRRKDVRGDSRPVFLFVNLMDTHLPYAFEAEAVSAVRGPGAVPGAAAAARQVGDLDAKLHLMGRRTIRDTVIADLGAAYDGAIRRDDRITGEILDILREEGILEDAFVAVTSDHGENLGEHGELNHALSVYDSVLRVPLVVRWPGRLEGGRVEDAQVRLQDLYPTILEAAGVPDPAPCGKDARSLAEVPLLPRTLVSEYGPMVRSLPAVRAAMPGATEADLARFSWLYRAVREAPSPSRGRKFIAVLGPGADGAPVTVREELYDTLADPGETRNLLGPGATPDDRADADRMRAVGEAGR